MTTVAVVLSTEILQMEAPVTPRLRPLASFCKTDAS